MFPWDEMIRLMAEFPSAVLTAAETDGAIRAVSDAGRTGRHRATRARADTGRHDAPTRPGIAALAQARCAPLASEEFPGARHADAGRRRLSLQPVRLTTGVGFGGLRGTIRFAREARHTADRYLADRRLARPPVPWDEIIAVKKAAKRARKTDAHEAAPNARDRNDPGMRRPTRRHLRI